jgi:hypothetical protein
MEQIRIELLRADWQRAVREYDGLVRSARINGTRREELNEVAQLQALKLDIAYARFKEAESKLGGRSLFV